MGVAHFKNVPRGLGISIWGFVQLGISKKILLGILLWG
jgi:hypothetical protein